MPNVLSPRDLVFRPDNMDETVPHTHQIIVFKTKILHKMKIYDHGLFSLLFKIHFGHKNVIHRLIFKIFASPIATNEIQMLTRNIYSAL